MVPKRESKRRRRVRLDSPTTQQLRIVEGLNPVAKQILIGITGAAGSGKDTVAKFMRREFSQYMLAGPLKRAIEGMFGLHDGIWEDRTLKEAVLPWLGKSPRQLAQTLGTEWGRQMVHNDLWVLLMKREWDRVRVGARPRLVVSDVRFDNEAQAIIDCGGTVWRVLREGVAPVATHVSEAGVSKHLIEGDIKNYGSLDELRQAVNGWMTMLNRRYAK